jgi:hypothetical protein
MENTINIYSQAEIVKGLEEAFATCTAAVERIPNHAWDFRPKGKWSAGQNLDHLIKSTKPLNTGLSLPKFAIRAQFGKPNDRPVKTFDELKERYYEKLAVVPDGMLSNTPASASEEIPDKETLLEEWKKATEKCVNAVSKKWPDKELDSCLLPHPLLGKLYVREVLFFTIFHTLHHTKTIEERISLYESQNI